MLESSGGRRLRFVLDLFFHFPLPSATDTMYSTLQCHWSSYSPRLDALETEAFPKGTIN